MKREPWGKAEENELISGQIILKTNINNDNNNYIVFGDIST